MGISKVCEESLRSQVFTPMSHRRETLWAKEEIEAEVRG